MNMNRIVDINTVNSHSNRIILIVKLRLVVANINPTFVSRRKISDWREDLRFKV